MSINSIHKKKDNILFRIFFISVVICLSVLSNTTESHAWSGRVVDKETGDPIEGVAIVRSWNETIAIPPHPYSGLLAVKETLTDKNGRFMIFTEIYFPVPIFRQVEESKPIIYKPGYKFLTLDRKTYIVKLEKVPTMYKTRKAEVEKARDIYYPDIYDTKILLKMIDREEEFIATQKYSVKSAPISVQTTPPSIQPRKRKGTSGFGSEVVAMDSTISTPGKGSKREFEKKGKKTFKASRNDRIDFNIRILSDRSVGAGGRSGAAASLGYFKNPRVVPALINALRDEASIVRYQAVAALRKIKDPKSVPYLIEATKDESGHVRAEAIRAIGEMENSRVVPALIAALRDENLSVRYEAAKALGKFDDPRKLYAVKPLIEDLSNKDYNIGRRAEYALVQIGKPAVELLIKALKNKDKNVRRAAALALGNIGDPRAIDPLIDLMNLNIKDSSWAAATALSNFKEKRVVYSLVKALEFSKGFLNERVSNSLCWMGSIAAEPMIVKLDDESPHIRIIALNYFFCTNDKRNAFFIKALKDENRRVRINAVRKITLLKDAEFVEPLISAWNDNDSEVRITAARALVFIGSAATEKLLITLKDDNRYFRWRATRCLGRIRDPKAVDSILLMLKDKNSEVKWTAIDALGEVKDYRAIEPLILMLGDNDIGMREKAAQSLMQITEQQMFGQDTFKWQKWWEQNKETFIKEGQMGS